MLVHSLLISLCLFLSKYLCRPARLTLPLSRVWKRDTPWFPTLNNKMTFSCTSSGIMLVEMKEPQLSQRRKPATAFIHTRSLKSYWCKSFADIILPTNVNNIHKEDNEVLAISNYTNKEAKTNDKIQWLSITRMDKATKEQATPPDASPGKRINSQMNGTTSTEGHCYVISERGNT